MLELLLVQEQIVAIETASIVLMRSDLRDIITAIDLSKKTCYRIRLNFLWACIYNFLSIPAAAGLLYPSLHIQVPPMVAGACMAFSSVSVVISSLLLRWYKKPNVANAYIPAIPEKLEVVVN